MCKYCGKDAEEKTVIDCLAAALSILVLNKVVSQNDCFEALASGNRKDLYDFLVSVRKNIIYSNENEGEQK